MYYSIQYTEQYEKDYNKLSYDKKAYIKQRINRIISDGYFGDCKVIDKNLYELRIFSCGGIRIYYTIKNNMVVLLLTIGGKESKEQQQKDIKRAIKILGELL